MILLDTNVISELMRQLPNKKVIESVNKFPASISFISAVTYAEILQGVALLDEGKRKQKLSKVVVQILQLFDKHTLAFDKQSAPFYADVIQQRTQLGRPIDYPDAQIAAIALQYDLQLFTRNTRDFAQIANLQLFNPWM